MLFKRENLILIVFISCILILGSAPLYAAWWDFQGVPTPQNTEELKKDKRLIMGSEMEFTFYANPLSVDELRDFYRTQLPNLGWKENSPLKNLSNNPDFKNNENLETFSENNLIFQKEEDAVFVTFLPKGASKDSRTHFSIAKGKINLKQPTSESEEVSPVAQLLTKPKKDVAPQYPDAKIVSLEETENTLRATYFTKDDIETVDEFYKDKMLNYGWIIKNEQPINKTETPGGGAVDIAKICPNCTKLQAEKMAKMKPQEMYSAELVFANENQDACRIILVNTVPDTSVKGMFGYTIIGINYEKAKK